MGIEQSKTKSLTLPGPAPKPSRSRMALIPLHTTPSSNVDQLRVIARLPPANAYTEKARCFLDAGISQRSCSTSTESGTFQEQFSHRIDRLGCETVPKELP